MSLQPIDHNTLQVNPFTMINDDWFLLTAGNQTQYNTMTASWGTMGILWGLPVINAYVRPHRYTHDFVEKEELFTVSFYDESYRKALNFCGSKSGRDYDKAKECNLTPIMLDGAPAFAEANLVFVCRKIYRYTLSPAEMIDPSNDKHYPLKDYHDCYYGEIIATYQSK